MTDPADKVTAAFDTAKAKINELAESGKVQEALGTARDKIDELVESGEFVRVVG